MHCPQGAAPSCGRTRPLKVHAVLLSVFCRRLPWHVQTAGSCRGPSGSRCAQAASVSPTALTVPGCHWSRPRWSSWPGCCWVAAGVTPLGTEKALCTGTAGGRVTAWRSPAGSRGRGRHPRLPRSWPDQRTESLSATWTPRVLLELATDHTHVCGLSDGRQPLVPPFFVFRGCVLSGQPSSVGVLIVVVFASFQNPLFSLKQTTSCWTAVMAGGRPPTGSPPCVAVSSLQASDPGELSHVQLRDQ